MKQKTIAGPVTIKGVGLHKGQEVTFTLKPAPVDHGVIFIRIDLEENNKVAAILENVTGVVRGTSIGNGSFEIFTVEHVLSALAIMGINNVIIELDATEPPALDGSSLPLIQLIEEAGVVNQEKEISPYVINEIMEVNVGDKKVIVSPSKEFKVSFTIDYQHPLIKTQFAEYTQNGDIFKEEIAGARTFGFLSEHKKLMEKGLALGCSTQNAVVLDDDGVIDNELRWDDEFVRHKILDVIGDIFLLNRPIKGHIVGIRSGHAMNIELARQIKKKMDKEAGIGVMDILEIKKILPHRYPFLLVDRIVEMEGATRCRGYKNVTVNEEFFSGHFPQRPVMPGVLIIEALAQLAGVFMLSKEEHKGKLPFFVGIDNVRFRRPVVPGDCLELTVEIIRIKSNTGKVSAQATVEGKLVASGELMFTLVEG